MPSHPINSLSKIYSTLIALFLFTNCATTNLMQPRFKNGWRGLLCRGFFFSLSLSIKAHFGRRIHNNRSRFLSVRPLFSFYAQPGTTRIVSRLVSLVFTTFPNHRAPLVRIYPKTNLDYFKDTTYNFPLSAVFPFDSRLTHVASGPIGVRLWGASKPPLLIPFHHLTRDALKPQGQLLPFLFFQTAQCGLANSQSETCLHSVTDNALAPRQPIKSAHTTVGFICKHLA